MPKIVFDIETVGEDFDGLDSVAQEYFLKFANTDEEKEEAKRSLSFYPLTAQIVAIGMLEVESEQGFVFFQNGSAQMEQFSEGNITYVSGDEKSILENFWKQMKKYSQFVTFNGRLFDGPFVMLRSAINHVPAGKNLVPYRYAHNQHIDLADQMTFYDAMRRKFSLHMWCRAFNIASPKDEGVTGLEVKELFEKGKYHDIARYCMRDVQATKELYMYWEKYLRF